MIRSCAMALAHGIEVDALPPFRRMRWHNMVFMDAAAIIYLRDPLSSWHPPGSMSNGRAPSFAP
jgi:hypothetical protein